MSYDPRLHPQIVQVFEAMKAAGVKRVESLTPEMARHQHRRLARARVEPEIELGLIDTFAIDAPGRRIPVRLYHPPGYEQAGPLPALFYFHGGGHVIGDLDTHDQAVRALAKKANCLAISVDYRKGPARGRIRFSQPNILSIGPRATALIRTASPSAGTAPGATWLLSSP